MTSSRHSVPDHILEALIEAAKNSPCRSQRGVVLWDHHGIISSGANHLQIGTCDKSDRCKATCGKAALHAEEAAIAGASRTRSLTGTHMAHIKIVDGKPVASGPPSCVRCSNQILAHGIAFMWLLHQDGWREYSAYDFHRLTLDHVFGLQPL
jgi:deoxycytidylate deaminase